MVLFIGGGSIEITQRIALFRYMRQLKSLGVRFFIFAFGPSRPDFNQFSFLLDAKSDFYYLPTFKALGDEKVKNQAAGAIQASMKSIGMF